MTLGESVRGRRVELGKSIYQLSRETGIAYSALTMIEKGDTPHPREETLSRLEEALGISLDAFRGKQKKPSYKKRDYRPRFAACRKATGRTQGQAAEALRVKKDTLVNWEMCLTSPPAWTLLDMAHLYGVTVGYLIGDDDKPFTGRRCAMEGPCAAEMPVDYCCHDCPNRKNCECRCENSPDRCRLVRTIRTLEEMEGTV